VIGVFDSGHGGLTILRALVHRLPERAFVYFGDHAHAPYGERTSAEIIALTRQAIAQLFARGCRLVILACNTAAAVGLRSLQQEWLPGHAPDRRILGVLVPTVEAVTGMPWLAAGDSPRTGGAARTLAVFATRRTVASNAYPEEIGKRAPEITLVQHACTGLVSLIEHGASTAALRAAVHGHVRELMNTVGDRRLDAALLGCTHYPLVADLFAEALPAGLKVVSQPELVAASLVDYLRRHPELDAPGGVAAPVQFLTTGNPDLASRFAATFFGHDVAFAAV
jgi:glutamate racemase